MSYRNGFKIGNFRFFKDPELTLPLGSSNLLDQITPDGWIDLYFGGQDIYLPDYGTFQAHIVTDKTFFWDLEDENGNRTKEGLERMWISRNPNMVPMYGDYIPKEPEKLFDWYSPKTATTKDEVLIASNIWFYNNLFLDEYFRYFIICLPKDYTWPDEHHALILPMNDKIIIPKDYYIVGYRPKPEYRYQLAVMHTMKSGQDSSIHFKFKLDMDYFFEHPNAKRVISIFGLKSNNLRYVLYPRDPKDIIWDRFQEPFIPQFKRFLLVNGIQEYIPSKDTVKSYVKKREKYLKYNNMFYYLDGFNKKLVIEEIAKKENDPHYKLEGMAEIIFKYYKDWKAVYDDNVLPTKQIDIMEHILFVEMPWAGFKEIYEKLGDNIRQDKIYGVNPDGSPIYYDLPKGYDPNNPNVKFIEEINGVKRFNDEWVPDNSLGYLSPPKGYSYAGDIGNGMYLIKMGDKKVPVYCDMDNGGWMFVMDSMIMDTAYVAKMVKELPASLHIEQKGIWFGKQNAPDVLFYPNLKFTQIKAAIVDLSQKPGEFKLEIYSDKKQFIFCSSTVSKDRWGSTLTIDSNVKYDLNHLNAADTYISEKTELASDNLTVKMTPGNNYSEVIKYLKFLWVR